MLERRGIAVAGNLTVDTVKTIPSYPGPGMLATIGSLRRAVGGCVPNTLLDLARMGDDIKLAAIGRVGDDEPGRYLLDQLRQYGVRTDGVRVSATSATSFSDVISAEDTGERTFFHYRGANAEFCPDDMPAARLDCRLLHIGYILLLDAFDQPDDAHGTVLARYLRGVQAQGVLTCVDVVSDVGGRFAQTVAPALRWCDYAIMNEIEACAVSGLPPRDGQGRLIEQNLVRTLETFMRLGVRRRAVIHCPEGGCCMDADTGYVWAPSFRLPAGFIKGSVGAGDAFCAGCLRAVYEGRDAGSMLRLGAAAAAASLSAVDSVSGMKPLATLERWISTGEVAIG